MKKTIKVFALVMALMMSFSSLTPSNAVVFGRSGKKITKIKFELYNGKINTEDKSRPSPDDNPTYQDGSKDEQIINTRLKTLYYSETGVAEIHALAFYDDNEVLGEWVPIENTEYAKWGGHIDESVKYNNATNSNVTGNLTDTTYEAVKDENGNLIGFEEETPLNAGEEPAEWATDQIVVLKEAGIIKEDLFSNYTFNITRQDFAYLSVILCKELGVSYIPGIYAADEKTFNDTKDEDVLKAYKLEIVNGYGNGKFGPSEPVTREQIDIMLVKAIDKAEKKLDKSSLDQLTFKDHDQISDWAEESVRIAYKNKIMNGVAELTIAPKNNTTREQALVLIYNILKKYDAIK